MTGTKTSVDHMVFECPACHQPVTRPLEPLPSKIPVCYKDGQNAVPAGYFAVSDDEYWTGSAGCPLINLADLVGTHHHPDPRRNSGCCGRDGCDGPNIICGCGHEIGTEKSDCWMAHAAVLLANMPSRKAMVSTYLLDGRRLVSPDAFWREYIEVVKPQGAEYFGCSLAAFSDAVTGGGPGWPGTNAVLRIEFSSEAAKSLGAEFMQRVGEICAGRVVLELV